MERAQRSLRKDREPVPDPRNRDQEQLSLRRIPAYWVRRLNQICTVVLAEAVESERLSVLQWLVFAHIGRNPDIDQSRLAETASIDKTNAGRLVDQLEAMGFIERRSHETDRRAWKLRLTSRGKDLRARLGPRTLAAQDKLIDCLSTREREVFLDLLVRVVEANEAHVRPGGGRRKPVARPLSRQQ
jgi:DNA-binding MarR family transcriptional regulator